MTNQPQAFYLHLPGGTKWACAAFHHMPSGKVRIIGPGGISYYYGGNEFEVDYARQVWRSYTALGYKRVNNLPVDENSLARYLRNQD